MRRIGACDRSAASEGSKRHGGNDCDRSTGKCGKALVPGSLRPGLDCDRARRAVRLAVAYACDQRLDQGARRRLHQADQDGDRADHLLHRGIRHRAYTRCQEGRPDRRQGAGLFRGRLDLCAGDRSARRQPGPARARFRRRHGERASRRRLRQAGRGAEERRFLPAHHSRHGGRRLRAGRNPPGPAVLDSVRLCADGPRRARPYDPRLYRRCGAWRCSASSPS